MRRPPREGKRIPGRVLRRAEPGVCRKCGCTDEQACPEGCSWVDKKHTLCSACAPTMAAR